MNCFELHSSKFSLLADQEVESQGLGGDSVEGDYSLAGLVAAMSLRGVIIVINIIIIITIIFLAIFVVIIKIYDYNHHGGLEGSQGIKILLIIASHIGASHGRMRKTQSK